MTAKILNGSALAEQIYHKIAKQTAEETRAPGLAMIMVGKDLASQIYVNQKRKACKKIGFISKEYNLPTKTTEKELINLIGQLNKNQEIDGILVQLPLPKHINPNAVLMHIRQDKDVDGFHVCNLGRLVRGEAILRPCTPSGIMKLLQHYIDSGLQGVDATIIGHSTIVGKPMALELLSVNATVSVCHIFTNNLKSYVKKADLLIVAAGVPKLVGGSWIKKGAIVIDVGANYLNNRKLVGDVDFDSAKERASWITPVPGGVGPMTVATLMENTLIAKQKRDIYEQNNK